MIYVQIRFYLLSKLILPIIPYIPNKNIKLKLVLWGCEVTLKTFLWKLKNTKE